MVGGARYGEPRRAPVVTWPNIGVDSGFAHLRFTISEYLKNTVATHIDLK